MRSTARVLGCAALTVALQAWGAEPPKGPPLAWAAVAIHEVPPGRGGGHYSGERADGFNDRGLNLREILSQAYNFSVLAFREDEVDGLPEWARRTRYDVVARVEPEDVAAFKKLSTLSMQETTAAYVARQPTAEMLMVQSLLADRFHLRVHWEDKERDVYTLVVAKGGARMKAASDTEQADTNANRGHLSGVGVPCSFLASMLSVPADRIVLDRTGLTGAYDFDLRFTPRDRPPDTDDPDSDFFTAVQEQLGLKVKSERVRVPVLVVDHVEPPTPN